MEGEPQMLFDHISGNAKPGRNLGLMQVLEPPHDQDLPASGREIFDGVKQAPHAVIRLDLLFGLRGGGGQSLRVEAQINVLLLGSAPTPVIASKIDRDRMQECPGFLDRRGLLVAEETQVGFLNEVRRVLRADPAGQDLKQFAPGERKKILKKFRSGLRHFDPGRLGKQAITGGPSR